MPCHSLLSRDWTSLILFLRTRAEEAAPLARGQGQALPWSCCLQPWPTTQRTSKSDWPLQGQLTQMRENFLRVPQGWPKGSNLIPKLGQTVHGSLALA